jgi:hypothetical protein
VQNGHEVAICCEPGDEVQSDAVGRPRGAFFHALALATIDQAGTAGGNGALICFDSFRQLRCESNLWHLCTAAWRP